jgi:hypothetical protein
VCKSSVSCPRHQDSLLSPPIPSCLLTGGGPPKVLEKHDNLLPKKPFVAWLALWVVVRGAVCVLSVCRQEEDKGI